MDSKYAFRKRENVPNQRKRLSEDTSRLESILSGIRADFERNGIPREYSDSVSFKVSDYVLSKLKGGMHAEATTVRTVNGKNLSEYMDDFILDLTAAENSERYNELIEKGISVEENPIIRINRDMIKYESDYQVKQTVLHEMAHLINRKLYNGTGHDEKWTKVALELGYELPEIYYRCSCCGEEICGGGVITSNDGIINHVKRGLNKLRLYDGTEIHEKGAEWIPIIVNKDLIEPGQKGEKEVEILKNRSQKFKTSLLVYEGGVLSILSQ
jgi:hypothetical protein